MTAAPSPDLPPPAHYHRTRRTGPTLAALLKETAAAWVRDNAMRLSAALSLYAILSLAPLLVITLKVVGVVWTRREYAREQITRQMAGLMGSQAAEALKPMIESGGRHGHGVLATVLSTAILLFSATGVFIELQDAMNIIWGVMPKPGRGVRDFVLDRLLSLGMVFGIGFLLLSSMLVSAILAAMAGYVAGDKSWLAFLADIVVSFGLVTVLFGAVFKFLPDVRLAWGHVWIGATTTGALFTAGKYALVLYFGYAAPTSAFGAAGSLVAVLLWVYYSSFILFFGAEFTKTWALHHSEQPIVPDESAVKVNGAPTRP
jgi:membrane protein